MQEAGIQGASLASAPKRRQREAGARKPSRSIIGRYISQSSSWKGGRRQEAGLRETASPPTCRAVPARAPRGADILPTLRQPTATSASSSPRTQRTTCASARALAATRPKASLRRAQSLGSTSKHRHKERWQSYGSRGRNGVLQSTGGKRGPNALAKRLVCAVASP